MSAIKLQKLVYYSQAWHLVWDEVPLFDERIEAWANGPVVPELYRRHRGRFQLDGPGSLTAPGGDPEALQQNERETVDAVLSAYGPKQAHWLTELTHSEAPWRDARKEARLAEHERGDVEITQRAMAEYYDALTESGATADV